MKKFLSILMIAFIASFTVTSCGSSEGGDVAETPVYNSEYFADVVSSTEGDFIGLNLGD